MSEKTEQVNFRASKDFVSILDWLVESMTARMGFDISRGDAIEAAVKRYAEDEKSKQKRQS